MIVFQTIKPKQTFRLKNNWDELLLEDAINLHQICDRYMPKVVKEIYTLYANGQHEKQADRLNELLLSVTNEDNTVHLPLFYGHLIKALSDMPEDMVNQLSPAQRATMYETYLTRLISELLFFPNIEYKGISSFNMDGVDYYLPKTDSAMGVEVPMEDRTALEFSEVADLDLSTRSLTGGRYERAANIISILCRPMVKGKLEKYDQKTCLKRADIFLKLPMPIVFEVFFCFIKLSIISGKQDLTFLKEEKVKPQSIAMVGMGRLYRLRRAVSLAISNKQRPVTYMTG